MKLAFCVEDETDEEIFAVILNRALGTPIEADKTTYRFRRGGCSQALELAPLVALRAANAGLDGALFAIDNDGKPEHTAAHSNDPSCRFCQLQEAANVAKPLGWSRPGLPSLRYFFAVPVQVIETWLLIVKGHPFSGRPEAVGVDSAGRRLLKRWLYGNDFASRNRIREVAIPLAERLNPQSLANLSSSFAEFLRQC
jgi:hypothetical protein